MKNLFLIVRVTHIWLGEGETLEKYLKRPLLLAITFAFAHVSTFYYEKYWINLGKKLTEQPVEPIKVQTN